MFTYYSDLAVYFLVQKVHSHDIFVQNQMNFSLSSKDYKTCKEDT